MKKPMSVRKLPGTAPSKSAVSSPIAKSPAKNSGRGTSDDLVAERRTRAKSAGLSSRQSALKRSDITSRKAEVFFDYFGSDAHTADLAGQRGFHLAGDAGLTSDLLALAAKTYALSNRSAYMLTVHQLVFYLEGDDDKRKMLTRAQLLFIDGFEKDFRSEEVPYSLYQRMEVEDFLKSRVDRGLVNNYSSSRRWSLMRWWSADFLNFNENYVREISLV